MSAHMKRHHIKKIEYPYQTALLFVTQNGITYAIPMCIAEKYAVKVSDRKHKPKNIAAAEIFADLDRELTRAGALLKGVRMRENLTQIEFAKKIGVTQANLSNMENGKRAIGKQIAKRIEKAFDVNYRYFLE